jgi:photosynthetic reaction center cytochrome c subunit
MYNSRNAAPLFSERSAFLAVFALISLAFLVGSIGVVWWISGYLRAQARAAAPQPSPIYTAYTNLPSNYLKPESLAAMTAYTNAHPQPQNVQILKGLSTAQIANYMVAQVSGGLKVDCTHCHNLANGNFADESNPNKAKSRQMMLMSADLNQNFVAKLPESVGNKQITCATCHNGRPVNFNGQTGPGTNYPADQSTNPDSFRLPLDNLDVLKITGKRDPDLNAVQLNQYTMYHMNQSLGVGCTFCHNARYFPSNEIPQKGYALTMLQMTQHIKQQYLSLMNNKEPSCWMCHRGASLPPGSANPGQVPAVLSSKPQ